MPSSLRRFITEYSVCYFLERLMMIEKHLEEMNDLADILFAMDQNFQDRENEARSEYQSMRDEIKNKVSCGFTIVLEYDSTRDRK